MKTKRPGSTRKTTPGQKLSGSKKSPPGTPEKTVPGQKLPSGSDD